MPSRVILESIDVGLWLNSSEESVAVAVEVIELGDGDSFGEKTAGQ
jgi:hypothetical protein